jgi:hypothetical protein
MVNGGRQGRYCGAFWPALEFSLFLSLFQDKERKRQKMKKNCVTELRQGLADGDCKQLKGKEHCLLLMMLSLMPVRDMDSSADLCPYKFIQRGQIHNLKILL